jgi:hypothetical protein
LRCENLSGNLNKLMPPRPRPSVLDSFNYSGYIYGEQRWTSHDGKRIYTWDNLHGEIEVYNKRGRHLAAIDPLTGKMLKEAVPGRSIRV